MCYTYDSVGKVAGSTAIGSAVGSVVPVAGNIIGAGISVVAGVGIYFVTEVVEINGKSAVDCVKDVAATISNGIVDCAKAVWDFISF